jgi:hypothetical protein
MQEMVESGLVEEVVAIYPDTLTKAGIRRRRPIDEDAAVTEPLPGVEG